MTSPTPPARGKLPSDTLQHIQFEGCDVCVIAPEDYDALLAALEKASPALSMARLQFVLNGENYNARLIDDLLAALRAARGDGK